MHTSRGSGPAPDGSPSLFALCLWCQKCGKSEDHTVSGVFDFLTKTWPKCCGVEMAVRMKLNWPQAPGGGTLPGLL